nr:tetratricopeptide repeat protein [Desulfobacteraceae bacterium]
IGRLAEAEQIFKGLGAREGDFQAKGREALADLYFTTGRLQDALPIYEGLRPELVHTSDDAEIIRKLGLTQCGLGNETACRDHLYRYLNVAGNSPHRAEVLFELGESSWRGGDANAARKLYEQTVTQAGPRERAGVLARFRLALEANQGENLAAGDDGPYQAVLDQFGGEPIAQDARHALLQRLMARGEVDRSVQLAKAYLDDPQGPAAQREDVAAMLCKLLAGQIEKMLQAKEYRQVCDLYQDEYRYLSDPREGKVLYLAGQAFEALGLFDQAAVVYYRALAGELTPEEKDDLYLRRARVYLAEGDLKAAERLLNYLRDLYAGKKELGPILALSGRLREAQGKSAEAANFYGQACGAAKSVEGASSCLAEVRLLLQLHRLAEAGAALDRSRQQGRMTPEALQQGLGMLGDAWRAQGNAEQGAAAYEAALAAGLPQEGPEAQRMHLGLGDLCLKLGRTTEGIAHYQKARTGPDPLLSRSAEEGLRLAGIEKGVVASRSLGPEAHGTP